MMMTTFLSVCLSVVVPARYLVGQLTLATGDDKQAEILFLGTLDAEPSTYGACAALLSVLHQVRGA